MTRAIRRLAMAILVAFVGLPPTAHAQSRSPAIPELPLYMAPPAGVLTVDEICKTISSDLPVRCAPRRDAVGGGSREHAPVDAGSACGGASCAAGAVAFVTGGVGAGAARITATSAGAVYAAPQLELTAPAGGGQSAMTTQLGAAAAVALALFTDGGYATDNRAFGNYMNGIRYNLDTRTRDLQNREAAQKTVLAALAPRSEASLAAQSAYAASTASLANKAEYDQARIRDGVAHLGPLAPLLQNALLMSVNRERQIQDIVGALPRGVMRPDGPDLGGLLQSARERVFSNDDPIERETEREATKLSSTLNGRHSVLRPYEQELGADYAIAKLRMARALRRQSEALPAESQDRAVYDSAAREAIRAARSARYWIDGRIGGVVGFDNVGTGQQTIIFDTNPHQIAGEIFTTLMADGDNPSVLGDWGLPSLAVTFADTPPLPQLPRSRPRPIQPPALPRSNKVDDNIVESIQFLQRQALVLKDNRVLTGDTIVIVKYFWFYGQVQNEYGKLGDERRWDYKQDGPQFRYAGNFNYGATGAALGIPLTILQRAAGYAQIKAHTWEPDFGLPWTGPPFGDAPIDQLAIEDGYTYYEQNRVRFDRVRFPLRPPTPLPAHSK